MSLTCFVCDAKFSSTNRSFIHIFKNKSPLATNKTVLDVLVKILGFPLLEENLHTSVLCKNCYNRCAEFDDLTERLEIIKSTMQSQHSTTASKYKSKLPKINIQNKIMLPVSKLQPLAPEFISKQNYIGSLSRPTFLSHSESENLNTLDNNVNPGNKADIVTPVSSQPKDDTDISDTKMIRIDDHCEDLLADEDKAAEMEIDEDCSGYPVQPDSFIQNDQIENHVTGGSHLAASDAVYTSKFEIVDGQDVDLGSGLNEESTLLMKDENGVIRLLSVQKLYYNSEEIYISNNGFNVECLQNEETSKDSNDVSQTIDLENQHETNNPTDNKVIEDTIGAEQTNKQPLNVEESKCDYNQEHLPKILEKVGNMYKCLLCKLVKDVDKKVEITLYTCKEGQQHARAAHNARVYVCVDCDAHYYERRLYASHMIKVHKTIPEARVGKHKCETCEKSFSSKVALAEHSHSHSGDRPYTCSVCGKSFTSRYTHQTHLKTHTDRPRVHRCDICDKRFMAVSNLRQHKKTHATSKDFVCGKCGKAFSSQHNLVIHGVVHSDSRPFKCSRCERAFLRRAELRDHERTHTGERPFSCSWCDARFSQRSNLQSHERFTHLGQKPHACQLCPKAFKRKRLLDYHVKASHTGERPLRCAECAATFVYPEHLKKHMTLHSGDKPFPCEVCGVRFSSRDNRKKHWFTHSEKRAYECARCGAGFMRLRALFAHAERSGHPQDTIIVNRPRVADVDEEEVISEDALASKRKCISVEKEELRVEDKDKLAEDDATREDPEQSCSLITEAGIVEDRTDANWMGLLTTNEVAGHDKILASTKDDSVLRLVQIQLPNGDNGWVALKT